MNIPCYSSQNYSCVCNCVIVLRRITESGLELRSTPTTAIAGVIMLEKRCLHVYADICFFTIRSVFLKLSLLPEMFDVQGESSKYISFNVLAPSVDR